MLNISAWKKNWTSKDYRKQQITALNRDGQLIVRRTFAATSLE